MPTDRAERACHRAKSGIAQLVAEDALYGAASLRRCIRRRARLASPLFTWSRTCVSQPCVSSDAAVHDVEEAALDLLRDRASACRVRS